MIHQFSFDILNLFQKNHIFLTYNPYLTFTGEHDSFIDNQGNPSSDNGSLSNLYKIGKKAFHLLEIQSEDDLQKLFRGYFNFIVLIATLVLEMHLKDKLDFEGESDVSGKKIFTSFIKKPTRGEAIFHAPTLLRLALTWGNELSLNDKSSDYINLLNDVYAASLIHVLLELDDILMYFEFDNEASLRSMESIVRCFSYAEFITDTKQLKNTQRKMIARFAANKRHQRTNFSKQKIIEIWATGKYSSRDVCAEQECAALNLSFSTARKALRNLPNST